MERTLDARFCGLRWRGVLQITLQTRFESFWRDRFLKEITWMCVGWVGGVGGGGVCIVSVPVTRLRVVLASDELTLAVPLSPKCVVFVLVACRACVLC